MMPIDVVFFAESESLAVYLSNVSSGLLDAHLPNFQQKGKNSSKLQEEPSNLPKIEPRGVPGRWKQPRSVGDVGVVGNDGRSPYPGSTECGEGCLLNGNPRSSQPAHQGPRGERARQLLLQG